MLADTGQRYLSLHFRRVGSRADFEAMNRAIGMHDVCTPMIDRMFPFAEAKAAYRHSRAAVILADHSRRHCQINVCRAKEPQAEYAITLRQPRFSIDPPPRLGKFGASRARQDGVGG